MDDSKEGFGCGVVVASICWAIGTSIAHCTLMHQQESQYQQQAIEHGAARHNPQTGEFEWVGKETEKR